MITSNPYDLFQIQFLIMKPALLIFTCFLLDSGMNTDLLRPTIILDLSSDKIEKGNWEYQLTQDLGLKVKDLTENEKSSLHLANGIKVVEIHNGKNSHITQMRVGFVILKANNIPIHSTEQFHEVLSTQHECSVILEGVYPDSPTVFYYAFELE